MGVWRPRLWSYFGVLRHDPLMPPNPATWPCRWRIALGQQSGDPVFQLRSDSGLPCYIINIARPVAGLGACGLLGFRD